MEKNRPCYEKRIGVVRLAIWENTADSKGGDNGAPVLWHNVAITRRYKDASGEWKESTTFNGLGDLAQVATAVWLAQDWIRRRQDGQGTEAGQAE
jgi:hypothetical protein